MAVILTVSHAVESHSAKNGDRIGRFNCDLIEINSSLEELSAERFSSPSLNDCSMARNAIKELLKRNPAVSAGYIQHALSRSRVQRVKIVTSLETFNRFSMQSCRIRFDK